MSADVIRDLNKRFEEKARELEQMGQNSLAALLDWVIGEIDEMRNSYENELLTITEASKVSGFSSSHLYHLVETGQLENAGAKGSPRIARAHLPRKAVRSSIESNGAGLDLADQVLRSRAGGR